jgi:hypothetical protein
MIYPNFGTGVTFLPENPEAAAMAVAIQRPPVKDQSIGVTSTLDILFHQQVQD